MWVQCCPSTFMMQWCIILSGKNGAIIMSRSFGSYIFFTRYSPGWYVSYLNIAHSASIFSNMFSLNRFISEWLPLPFCAMY